jgi:hypothetical protein
LSNAWNLLSKARCPSPGQRRVQEIDGVLAQKRIAIVPHTARRPPVSFHLPINFLKPELKVAIFVDSVLAWVVPCCRSHESQQRMRIPGSI